MENQIKISPYHQKKVISSIFNLLFFGDYKSPTFQVVDEIEVASLCDNFRKIVEQDEIQNSIEYFINQVQNKLPDSIQHQLFLMMISRPTHFIELGFFFEFETSIDKVNDENLKMVESFLPNRPIHPLVKKFIGEIVNTENGYSIYDRKFIEKDIYNDLLKKQIKQYRDSLNIHLS